MPSSSALTLYVYSWQLLFLKTGSEPVKILRLESWDSAGWGRLFFQTVQDAFLLWCFLEAQETERHTVLIWQPVKITLRELWFLFLPTVKIVFSLVGNNFYLLILIFSYTFFSHIIYPNYCVSSLHSPPSFFPTPFPSWFTLFLSLFSKKLASKR